MTDINDRIALYSLLRTDFPSFVHKVFATVAPGAAYADNWHIRAIAHEIESVIKGTQKRLILNLPPRFTKSIIASVALPAFILGHDPSKLILCISYSAELSEKHARDFRALVTSLWYRIIFPEMRISREKDSASEIATTRRGARLATSVNGTLTGRGGDLIIIDDPLKPDEAMSQSQRSSVNAWFDRTLLSRLDDQERGAIILVMQRLHVEDLTGHVSNKGGWRRLALPAQFDHHQVFTLTNGETKHVVPGELLHEDRLSKHTLDRLRSEMGSLAFSSQYLQDPVPPEGEIIKWSWFAIRDREESCGSNDRIVQSWDTASKAGELNDYSACTTWLVQGCKYHLIDVWRGKLEFPALRKKIVSHAQDWKAHVVLIENAGSGTQLIQDLQNARDIPSPIAIKVEQDKVVRMSNQSAKIEAGDVTLPKQASWLGAFKSELLQFPYGGHDDQVDSVSQFLKWAARRKHEPGALGSAPILADP